jgi:uncharacterized protein (TIGR03643 family)
LVALSGLLNKQLENMNVNGLIEMAWSDEATFSDIEREFGIKEPEVKRIMQSNLKPGSYRLWRKRVRWIKEKQKKHLKV